MIKTLTEKQILKKIEILSRLNKAYKTVLYHLLYDNGDLQYLVDKGFTNTVELINFFEGR